MNREAKKRNYVKRKRSLTESTRFILTTLQTINANSPHPLDNNELTRQATNHAKTIEASCWSRRAKFSDEIFQTIIRSKTMELCQTLLNASNVSALSALTSLNKNKSSGFSDYSSSSFQQINPKTRQNTPLSASQIHLQQDNILAPQPFDLTSAVPNSCIPESSTSLFSASLTSTTAIPNQVPQLILQANPKYNIVSNEIPQQQTFLISTTDPNTPMQIISHKPIPNLDSFHPNFISQPKSIPNIPLAFTAADQPKSILPTFSNQNQMLGLAKPLTPVNSEIDTQRINAPIPNRIYQPQYAILQRTAHHPDPNHKLSQSRFPNITDLLN